MTSRKLDPTIQAIIDEANLLPECAAQLTLCERAATHAETLGDLDTAWSLRCRILGSTSAMKAPKFENLFMCLAWCLGTSDAEPERFSSGSILWQYKWVATDAGRYANVSRGILERLVDDMGQRFESAGWGKRAGIHKRLELWSEMGEHQRAFELVPQWKATPRDRGSDCNACEANSLVSLYIATGQREEAIREAKPIIRGKLSCSTVPHSTFGSLLLPLVQLGRHKEATDLYNRGRRLVATMDEGACDTATPYLTYAAFSGHVDQAHSMLRTYISEAKALRSDRFRMDWFAHAAAALDFLEQRDEKFIDLPGRGALGVQGTVKTAHFAKLCREVALKHAGLLDARNGNSYQTTWVNNLTNSYGKFPAEGAGVGRK